MTETSSPARHRIYLLSVWREETEKSKPRLRFRLEDPRTGESQVYPTMDFFLAALRSILDDSLGEDKK